MNKVNRLDAGMTGEIKGLGCNAYGERFTGFGRLKLINQLERMEAKQLTGYITSYCIHAKS